MKENRSLKDKKKTVTEELFWEEPIRIAGSCETDGKEQPEFCVERGWLDDKISINRLTEGERNKVSEMGKKEVMAMISESIVRAGTIMANSNIEIAKAQLESGYQIANSILSASKELACSIERLVDEIERKNKQDEFYHLLDKIEEYEGNLMEFGCLKEVYEKLMLIQYPTIKVTDRIMCLLLSLEEDVLHKTMNVVKQKQVPILKALIYVFSKEVNWYGLSTYPSGWDWKIGNEGNNYAENPIWYQSKEGKLTQVTQLKYYVKDKNYKPKYGFISSEGEEILIGEVLTDWTIDQKVLAKRYGTRRLERYEVCKMKMKDKGKTAEDFVRIFYDGITNEDICQMYTKISYTKLKDEISKINQNIQLNNLRSLYMMLRNEVRNCRISRYLIEKRD